MELFIIYKISPDPSLLKRGAKLVPDIFILPLRKMGFYHHPLGKRGFIFPPLEKGGEGGFEKANKDRRDMELFIIYKISPYPSLLKRGAKLVPDIFIIPLWNRKVLSSPRWKRGFYHPPFGKGALIPPLFHHTIRYRAPFF